MQRKFMSKLVKTHTQTCRSADIIMLINIDRHATFECACSGSKSGERGELNIKMHNVTVRWRAQVLV